MNTNGSIQRTSPDQHWSNAVGVTWLREAHHVVVFEHHGSMDPTTLHILLTKAEEASLAAGDGVGLRKRLFNVLVEGLENMQRHTMDPHRESGIAVLVDRGDGYRLLLGNALPVASAALLVHRVGVLNEMEEVDMKEYFLKLLANDGRTDRGGAGLGLITMARKSAKPMLVHSVPKDEHTAYFALEIAVLRS